MATADSPGRADNDEAVSQFTQGKKESAIEGFRKAVKADPKSAESQYNVGLSFDEMGEHDHATAPFKQAALSPTNPAMIDSAIIKKRTSSFFRSKRQRHLSVIVGVARQSVNLHAHLISVGHLW